jgi:deoxyuridine 5'-triphosphate nucleotidohydrolase
MADDDTINENFFKVIDTPLKAYILGVVIFNNTAASTEAMIAAADNNLNVSINLNNVKDNDNTLRSISYGYYKDLKDEDKKHYPYFNNIDILLKHLSKIGDVKYTETTILTGIIELTITSKSIKDDITMHLNNEKGYLADFVNNADNANICNQFARAYIEKYSSIIYDNINITFYNDNIADSFVKLYDIPCNRQKNINNQVIQYNSVNMIDLLGMIYSNYECPYYNNYIYTYNNRDGKSIPCIKVFKVDADAVIPSKARYSDAGYDLTIIKEYKRLTSNTVIYDTGIKLEIPNGYYVEIVPRSSISRSGYMLANNVGIIDQGYRGNIYVALTKINDETPDITDLAEWRLPWKCCQMIVKKQIYSKLVVCDSSSGSSSQNEIEKSSRGTGAFGSTGN